MFELYRDDDDWHTVLSFVKDRFGKIFPEDGTVFTNWVRRDGTVFNIGHGSGSNFCEPWVRRVYKRLTRRRGKKFTDPVLKICFCHGSALCESLS